MAINRVLIVDDSETDRYMLSEMLKKAGFQPLLAVSGEEGVKMSKELKPDLVLMDIVMPGLNGFQATRAITSDESTKQIPVIIVTTKGQETDRVWGLRQGAKDYIVKPVDEADLVKKIRAIS